MNPAVNWLLVVVGAVLILIEILLGAASGFDFLLIGSSILAGGVLGLVLRSAAGGIAAAGVLSLLYVFVGRRRIRGKLLRAGIPSNVDALLGRAVEVVQEIAPNHPGRIKFEGEEWRALPDLAGGRPREAGAVPDAPARESGGGGAPAEPGRFEPGASVEVTRVDGVTVYVIPTGTRRP